MATQWTRTPAGAVLFTHTCEICLAPAYLGTGCDPLKALKAAKAKQADWWRHFGHWYCKRHWKG